MRTTSDVVDFKTGKVIHLSSQCELWCYLVMTYEGIGILEVHPHIEWSLADKVMEASNVYIQHRGDLEASFLADFDGVKKAVFTRTNEKFLQHESDVRKLYVASECFRTKGYESVILLKNDYSREFIQNIRSVMPYYNDPSNLLKHKLATRELEVPEFRTSLLRFRELWKHLKETEQHGEF